MDRVSGSRGSNSGNGRKLLIVGFGGLVAGVLIAFGVVLYLNRTPLPFQERTGRAEAGSDAVKRQDALSLPGKPGEKPRFEFYRILPGTQEPTPDNPAHPPLPNDQMPEQPQGQLSAPADQFYLQIGAFQKTADADNIKAKLALMGVEASVQDVVIPDKGTLHRVRTGPYATPSEMNQARTLMSQNGVQATVIKIKDPGNPPPAAESKPGKP